MSSCWDTHIWIGSFEAEQHAARTLQRWRTLSNELVAFQSARWEALMLQSTGGFDCPQTFLRAEQLPRDIFEAPLTHEIALAVSA